MNSKKVKFTNNDGFELSARLELPVDQHAHSYAIFAHCFTCNKNLTAVKNIARALTQHGFGVLRFDFTGLGESEGDFSSTDFSSNIRDLETAANYLAKHMEAPKLLVGHSLGGAAVIFAGKSIPSIEAIATIGAPSSPEHVSHLFKNDIAEIKEQGKAIVTIGGREFSISNEFIEDISEKNMQEKVKDLRMPLLLMHSPQDTVVGIANAADIYSHAMHPKSFISLDGADHLLSDKRDSLYAGNVIAEWASRYIDVEEKNELQTVQQVVVSIGKDGYTSDILAGGHALTADEPESMGGNNFGPSPYDLLLSSLGACTVMTLRMYADRKKWNLNQVIVHLSHEKDYAKDCEDCENSSGKIDLISRIIELEGELTDTEKNRLLEIADKCPIHKTLHSQVRVNTTLK